MDFKSRDFFFSRHCDVPDQDEDVHANDFVLRTDYNFHRKIVIKKNPDKPLLQERVIFPKEGRM